MKLIFIDEFKSSMKGESKMYGLSAVVLDSTYYTNYKSGFEKAFSELGWEPGKELKGRHIYSNGVFENITVEQRIKFAEKLFRLSLSESGKRRRINTFIAFDTFPKKKDEHEIYKELLCRIFKKLGNPTSSERDKNLIAIFLDNNDAVTKKIKELELYKIIADVLPKKWIIFEKPFFVKSSNLLPGIIFSDFVSYFHQNSLDTEIFFRSTVKKFLRLLDLPVDKITKEEDEELNHYINNFRKRKTTKRILKILKDIEYV
jgi:hypothetical protein